MKRFRRGWTLIAVAVVGLCVPTYAASAERVEPRLATSVVKPVGAPRFLAVDAVSANTHLLTLTDGVVGAFGIDSADGRTRVPRAARSGVDAIAAGNGFSLALKDGRVIAWGNNQFGQTEVPRAARSGVTAIAAGTQLGVALKNGRIIKWGANANFAIPSALQGRVDAIAAGTGLIALVDGRVHVLSGNSTVPRAARQGVGRISLGHLVALALVDDRVVQWNEPGMSWADDWAAPSSVRRGVTRISASAGQFAAVKGGRVIVWGDPWGGVLDVPLAARSGVSEVAVGIGFVAAIKRGELIMWGTLENNSG